MHLISIAALNSNDMDVEERQDCLHNQTLLAEIAKFTQQLFTNMYMATTLEADGYRQWKSTDWE